MVDNKIISVIIATYNRSDVLKRNLLEFEKQSDKDFEVVIAIDGSTDDTVEMLRGHKWSFPIRAIDTRETDKYCLAKARNMALIETRGYAVVILDDDSFPDVDFIKEHRSSVKRGVLTGGCRSSHDPSDELHPKMKWLLRDYGDCSPKPLNKILVENNCCMLREDWIGCGMFSERFEGYGGCGQEFFARLIHQKYEYQYNPRAKIYHHREFEGDNGLTRPMKMEQAKKMQNVIRKHVWSYNV